MREKVVERETFAVLLLCLGGSGGRRNDCSRRRSSIAATVIDSVEEREACRGWSRDGVGGETSLPWTEKRGRHKQGIWIDISPSYFRFTEPSASVPVQQPKPLETSVVKIF
ncbi:hypothetical protein ACOSQ2_032403 [Xanthoceras sorbifolium]